MDELFDKLRRRYRTRAGNQLELLDQALAAGDCQSVAAVAHSLNGSGATFGYPEVSRLAEPLELAAETVSVIAELRRLAEPLRSELVRIAHAD